MAISDGFQVHSVGAQGVCHQVDFGELCLKEERHVLKITISNSYSYSRRGKMTIQFSEK